MWETKISSSRSRRNTKILLVALDHQDAKVRSPRFNGTPIHSDGEPIN
jgi:hypothetical protein